MKKQSATKPKWMDFDALGDAEIDCSDIPPLDERYFREAVVWPGTKKQVTLRIDRDVLAFFRKQGRGYQTTMNGVLRKYMEARKSAETRKRRAS